MPSPQPKMSPEELWQYLDYCDATGHLYLKPGKQHPAIKKFYGDCINVQGHNYTFPRLSFYMHHGYLPAKIERIGSPLDIRIENLRAYEPVEPKPYIAKTHEQRQKEIYDAMTPKEKRYHDRLAREVQNTAHHNAIQAKQDLAKMAMRQAKRRERYLKSKQQNNVTQ